MKKINLKKGLYTTAIASLFVSATSIAAIPTMELIKAEPIKQESLKSAAIANLNESFSSNTVASNLANTVDKSMLVEHKAQSNKNETTILVQTSIIAD